MSPAGRSLHARARTLRTRLLVLAAGGLIPLLIPLAWGIDHIIDLRREEAQHALVELSRAIALSVGAELRGTEALLQQLAETDELESGDLRGFVLTARRTAEQHGWRAIILHDPEGRLLMRTTDEPGTRTRPMLDPDSLAEVLRNARPAVGAVVPSPRGLSEAFAVRVPVVRSEKLVYVLTAVVPTQVVADVLKRQDLPSGSLASVFDHTLRRVARSVPGPSPFPTETLRELLSQPGTEGSGRTLTQEGVENYTAFTRLPNAKWTISVGTSVSSVDRGLGSLLGAVGVGLAASLALALILSWLLSRRVMEPIEVLKKAAGALGRGEPVHVPELHVEELDDVAHALRQAAEDRDRALRELEDASRGKDQFLAMLGHELRNPLAPIATAVQVMQLKGDDRTAPERQVIQRQLVHVTRLVDDLLDISRITSGRLAISHEPLALAPVLRQVIDSIQPSLYHRTLTLDLAPGLDAAWVSGDEVRLVQVFNNLLVNAIKFTPPGGAIRMVASLQDERQVEVAVEDTGAGIPPADLARIFDLFFQAPQSFDRAKGGLGLGLAIVRSLVEMHGGSVSAWSEGAGAGSRFTVRLPLIEPPSLPPHETVPDSAEHGAARVLVVDDNEDAADTCATFLQMSGYTVRVAYTPKDALALLDDFAPDVAILDLGLPGMNGYELAAAMKAAPHAFHGRLIALTGYGQASDREATRRAGFDAHLTKPVSPGELLDLLGKFSNELEAHP